MNKKISCGGFEIDNETLIEENGVLKSVGGGEENNILFCVVDSDLFKSNMSSNEIALAINAGKKVQLVLEEVGGFEHPGSFLYISSGVAYGEVQYVNSSEDTLEYYAISI